MADKATYEELKQRIKELEKEAANHMPREALGLSGEKYRMLFDTAPDGVAIVDSNGVIVDCSQSLEQLYGYTKIDIIGKGFTEFMSPSSVPTCMSRFQDLQQGKSLEGELQIIKSDNTIVEVWRKAIPLTDESGDFAGVLAYDRDITERKRAEEALRKSEERYRLLVETMSDGLGVQDENGLLTYANNCFWY